MAGALGIRRDDHALLEELEGAVGTASRTDAAGSLLVDFHTAQGPSEKLLRAHKSAAKKAGESWRAPETRLAELDFSRADLDTLLSQRQYRVDAFWTVALWLRDGTECRWSLDAMRDALLRPAFVPYLGRKSCPLDIPLEPQVVEATSPAAAMERARFALDDVLTAVRSSGRASGSLQWEGNWPGLTPEQTSSRRDKVTSRARWQFTDRTEHQAAWSVGEEGQDVPEQG